MTILFAMIPLALLLLVAAVAAFFWAVRTGQFDDLEARGAMILFDDEDADRAAATARTPADPAPAGPDAGGSAP